MPTVWELLTQSSLRVLESLKRQNIALFLNGCREKVSTIKSTNVKLEQTILNRRFPKDEVWGNQIKKLQGKGRQQLSKKEERVWVILT